MRFVFLLIPKLVYSVTCNSRVKVGRLNFRTFVKVSSIMVKKNIKDLWDLKFTPKELNLEVEKLIDNSRDVYDSIGKLENKDITVDNLLKVLNEVEGNFFSELLYFDFPQHVSTEEEVRDASQKAAVKLREFNVEVRMREDIFKKLTILKEKETNLDPQYKRYLEFLIIRGRRYGLHLSKEVQKEIKATKNKINELCSQFMRNLSEVKTVIEVTEKELDGLPSDFINNLEKRPDTDKRIVTVKYPHYFPIMKKAKNPETRKRMLFAFNTQCMEENTKILEDLVPLKQKYAELLGYPNYASYAIADFNHAKNPENVKKFLSELSEKAHPQWRVEKAVLLEMKEKECKERNIPFDGRLYDYDLPYYSNEVMEHHYKVDEEKVREYFPLPYVSEQLLSIYQNLLGFTFKKVEDAKTWHPDVQMYGVEDTKTGNFLGYFFLDLFPREGKYGHAALFPLHFPYLQHDGTRRPSVGAMVTNLTKPTPEKPSLLTHSEVVTFFHEFGHVMHHMCLKNDIFQLNNTEELFRDFIEAPSQMLEEWCWEPSVLKMLSSHYIDKLPMPEDMSQALIKSRRLNVAGSILRQIVLCTFDQKIHSCKEADIKSVYRSIYDEILGVVQLEGTSFAAHFNHIVFDYEAQYYSYLWSEVFSKDMYWTRFKDGNVLNPAVGKEYREKIIEVGYGKDIEEFLRDFIGRDPNQTAFLVSMGLQK